MDKRFTTFLFSSMLLYMVYTIVLRQIFPPPPEVANAGKPNVQKIDAEEQDAGAAANPKDPNAPEGEKPPGDNPAAGTAEPGAAVDPAKSPAAEAAQPPAAPAPEPTWVTLGSGNAADPYRMLVTLTNVGAAIERVELNSPRYLDVDNRSGYLGHLAATNATDGTGALVRVVGPGTPAAAAGLKPGDIITAIDDRALHTAGDLAAALEATQPGQSITLKLDGDRKVTVDLVRRPLEMIRPELDSKALEVVGAKHDPFSMLLTLERIGERELPDDAEELRGVDLRGGTWEVVSANQDEAVFRKKLAAPGLEVTKRYRLAKVDPALGAAQPAYHLEFDIELRSSDGKEKDVAYRLDGPTGVVLEGSWYGSKIGRAWFASAGLRDIVAKFSTGSPGEKTPATIIEGSNNAWPTAPLQYVGVDAQYFTAALIPNEKLADNFVEVRALKAGATPADTANYKLTDVSFRVTSRKLSLPADEAVTHSFKLFLGPRLPALLDEYGPPGAPLGTLIYYGWFGWVAEPMLVVLHLFYSLVHNYGIAIVMLTVLVRGCMFPLSRKQAISSQKMQLIQPEMKALQEKYKKQPEQMAQAQRELYRKHNFNPLGGCLMAFIQLPIFLGLYRSLAVDIELRQAPLFSEAVRWCSNLAAPDMLWNWSRFMPAFVNEGNGFFGLGPFLNLFPLITISLFLVQQKMFMPPATDEQTIMQQKVMQIMTIVMGVMFFKVPSGLCLYFIASSLWSVTERKLLHPSQTPPGVQKKTPLPALSEVADRNGNGSDRGPGKKKQRGRK